MDSEHGKKEAMDPNMVRGKALQLMVKYEEKMKALRKLLEDEEKLMDQFQGKNKDATMILEGSDSELDAPKNNSSALDLKNNQKQLEAKDNDHTIYLRPNHKPGSNPVVTDDFGLDRDALHDLHAVLRKLEANLSDTISVKQFPQNSGSASYRNERNSIIHDSSGSGCQRYDKPLPIPTNLPLFRKKDHSGNGYNDPGDFLLAFERVCRAANVTYSRYTTLLSLCLDSIDVRWFESYLEEQRPSTWQEVTKAFIGHFQNPNMQAQWLNKLRTLRMDNGGVQRYSDRFLALIDKLGMTYDDPMTIFSFKAGLSPSLAEQISSAECNHLLAMEYSSNIKPLDVMMLTKIAVRTEANLAIIADTQKSKFKGYNSKPESSHGKLTPKLRCSTCGQYGHLLDSCKRNQTAKPSGEASKVVTPSKTTDSKEKFCHNCSKNGHYTNQCPDKKKATDPALKCVEVVVNDGGSAFDTQSTSIHPSVKNNSSSIWRKKDVAIVNDKQLFPSSIQDTGSKDEAVSTGLRTPCYLNGERILGFIDCGASHSFISKNWVDQQNLTITPVNGIIRQIIDGSEKPRLGRLEGVLLENDTKSIMVDLEVASLEGGEELIIGMDLFPVLGFEIRGVPFTWPKQKDVIPSEKPKPTIERPPDVDDNGIHISWKKVLEDNQALPASISCQLPGAELSIDTDSKPVQIRQYPIAEGYRTAVDAQVKTWLDNGVIELAPVGCKWNSPLLATRKPSKDGSPDGVRVCLDARALNDKILNIPDSNLPGIREIQDSLGEFEWITILDLADSYHQFPINHSDRIKTTFTWGGKQWMFKGVPFGLKIMTGHMQRLMEILVGKHGRLPFQDDIAIATKKGGDHVSDVLEVLKTLTYEAKLRLRLKKCQFFHIEARVLGSLVTRTGIKMDPLKIKAIANWQRPADGKAMQRFLGAANFHRDFSSKFAEIAAPLEAVRNQHGVIQWTDEMVESFQKIKELFLSNLELRGVKWNEQFYLTTDASLSGIGAWLGQADEHGEIVPVICISKKLSPTQQRWSATKRELYGLMWAMEKLRFYLLGRKFIARVDHRPLVAMLGNKLNVMMEGWVDTIMKFDFTPSFLPGIHNTLADALSRSQELLGMGPVIRKSTLDESPNISSVDIDKALLLEAERRGKHVPSVTERKKMIDSAHSLGHFSVEAMYRQIWNNGYWWPQIRNELKNAVYSCIGCLRFNISKEGFHPLRSVEADKVWDHIEIDLIGPLPESGDKYNYILTIVDVLSGYTVLKALKTKSMEEVARNLWETIADYGPPKILQSDNGSEFSNQVIEQLSKLYGIDQRFITAYNPRANGKVERKNKEVVRSLKKMIIGTKDKWELWLPTIQFALNQKEQKDTGSTPFSLMFGREYNSLIDYSHVSECQDLETALKLRSADLEVLKDIVLPAIVRRSKSLRADNAVKFKKSNKIVSPLSPGTKVMLLDQTRTGKLDPVYEGPYIIVRQTKGGSYVLKDLAGEELKRRATINMIKAIPDSVNIITEENQHFRVESILDHKLDESNMQYQYLVHWSGYTSEDDSWISAEDFDDINIIKKYWNRIQPKQPKSKKTRGKCSSKDSVVKQPSTGMVLRSSKAVLPGSRH